jgi:uncharacterized Zn-binding protein involved in type VI secretion
MNNARINDIALGVCICTPEPFPATGIIITGDPMHLIEGMPSAGLGDIVVFPCGTSVITTSKTQSINSGKLVATTSDMATGCSSGATILSSATQIITGK